MRSLGAGMLVNVAIFCGYVLIALVIAVFLWQTLFAPHDYGGHSPNAQQHQAEQYSEDKNLIGGGASPPRGNPAEEAIADYTRYLAFFTAALVFATVALFISGERNVEVSRESAEAARRSANIAKEAADATRDAVKLSEATAEKQLRAYITVKTIERVIDPNYPGHVTVEINYTNAGQTPAYDVSASISIDIREYPLNGSLTKLPDSIAPTGILGPSIGIHTRSKTKVPITAEDEAAVLAGKKAVYIWGRIEYRDIFGKPRYMEFSGASEGPHFQRGAFHEGPTPDKAD